MKKKDIIVVTGGAGFVGTNLIRLLLNKTKYKIISIDDYSSGSKKNHINDKRINRITKVLSRRYNTKSFYEESYRLNNIEEKKNIFYLKSKLSYFRIKSILKNHNVSSQFSLYIHDPGFFGLILCWWWSKNNNINSITFDYHDWLPWEISFHLRKLIKNKKLTMLLSKLIYSFIKQFFNSLKIDNLIGISCEQLQEFKKDFKLQNTRDLILPNTRKKILSKKIINNREFNGILWVGNIMKGRDIDILNKYIASINSKHLFAKVDESMLFLYPIFHLGCFITSLKLTLLILFLLKFNNGPPEAVK